MAGTEPEPLRRYQRENPGELIHNDVEEARPHRFRGTSLLRPPNRRGQSPRSPREQPVLAPQLAKTALEAAPPVAAGDLGKIE